MGEKNRRTTFFLSFWATEKILTGWLYEEIYLVWRGKKCPAWICVDWLYETFYSPLGRKKVSFGALFKTFINKYGWKKKMVENVAICNKLLVSLNVQQMGLTLSLIMNQKKLIDILLWLSLKKRVILYTAFHETPRRASAQKYMGKTW